MTDWQGTFGDGAEIFISSGKWVVSGSSAGAIPVLVSAEPCIVTYSVHTVYIETGSPHTHWNFTQVDWNNFLDLTHKHAITADWLVAVADLSVWDVGLSTATPSGGVPSPVSCNPFLVCPPQELLHFSHSIVNASMVIEMWCGPCNVWLFTGMSAYIEVKVGCVCAYTHTWLWLAQLYQSEQLATSSTPWLSWLLGCVYSMYTCMYIWSPGRKCVRTVSITLHSWDRGPM